MENSWKMCKITIGLNHIIQSPFLNVKMIVHYFSIFSFVLLAFYNNFMKFARAYIKFVQFVLIFFCSINKYQSLCIFCTITHSRPALKDPIPAVRKQRLRSLQYPQAPRMVQPFSHILPWFSQNTQQYSKKWSRCCRI